MQQDMFSSQFIKPYAVQKTIDPLLSCNAGKSWNTSSYRTILLDWIVEVLEMSNTYDNSFCLFSIYLEKYYSTCRIVRDDIQLIGLVSLWLASKIVTRDHMDVDSCVVLSNNTYNKKTIVEKERELLQLFDYKLLYITVSDFMFVYIDKSTLHQKNFEKASLYVRHAIWRNYSIASSYSSMEIGFSVATILTFLLESKDISLDIATTNERNYKNCLESCVRALSIYKNKRKNPTNKQKKFFELYTIPKKGDFVIL